MIKKLLLAIAVLSVSATALCADASKDVIKILCIGNSFTRDAISQVPNLMKAAGVDNVEITFAYYPGRPMKAHCDWSKKDYTIHKANAGQAKWITVTGSRAKDKAAIGLEQICKSEDWDIITFQEYSGHPDAWEWTDKQKGYFTKMFDQVKACVSKDVTYYYILTQAFYDMNKFKSKVSWGQHDTKAMFEVVAATGQKIMKDFPEFKRVISTGAAVENLRTTSLMNEEWGLSRDGFHLDYGAARCAAACTFFETVITPLVHKKLDKVKYTYLAYEQKTNLKCTPVTEKEFPICLKAARAAIKHPYKVTKINR